jgi:hypothetical protein
LFLSNRLLYSLAVCDVQHDPIDESVATWITRQPGFVPKPPNLTILVEHAIIKAERVPGVVTLMKIAEYTVAVVGVDLLKPKLAVGSPLVPGETQALNLGCGIDGAANLIHFGDVRDRRDPLKKRVVSGRRLAKLSLALMKLGYVPRDSNTADNPAIVTSKGLDVKLKDAASPCMLVGCGFAT